MQDTPFKSEQPLPRQLVALENLPFRCSVGGPVQLISLTLKHLETNWQSAQQLWQTSILDSSIFITITVITISSFTRPKKIIYAEVTTSPGGGVW